MSKHVDILPTVVCQLSRETPDSGIILHGSVQGGYERPDSDIDLFVITEEGDSMRFDLDRSIDGISIQVCNWPSPLLGIEMRKEPYLFYMLSHGRILSDSKGMARRHQAFGKEYFANHKGISELWEHQVAEVRQVRVSGSYRDGKFQPDADRYPKHLWWDEFAEHLRNTVNQDSIPSNEGN